MKITEITQWLTDKKLKVTPQRVAILEAIICLNNHPTADAIVEYIRDKNPNIAVATVYKVLDVLVENGLIHKVKTEIGLMRYEAASENHHHIYCSDSDRIDDYFDEELNQLLDSYFRNKRIPGFDIENIKLQIIGKYNTNH